MKTKINELMTISAILAMEQLSDSAVYMGAAESSASLAANAINFAEASEESIVESCIGNKKSTGWWVKYLC